MQSEASENRPLITQSQAGIYVSVREGETPVITSRAVDIPHEEWDEETGLADLPILFALAVNFLRTGCPSVQLVLCARFEDMAGSGILRELELEGEEFHCHESGEVLHITRVVK